MATMTSSALIPACRPRRCSVDTSWTTAPVLVVSFSDRAIAGVTSEVSTPRNATFTFLPAVSWSITDLAESMLIAKPMFWLLPARAVLMPTTSPAALTSGPPEFPGLMAASVWSMS